MRVVGCNSILSEKVHPKYIFVVTYTITYTLSSSGINTHKHAHGKMRSHYANSAYYTHSILTLQDFIALLLLFLFDSNAFLDEYAI